MSHAAPATPGAGKGKERPRGYVSVSHGVRGVWQEGARAVVGVSENIADRVIAATAPKKQAAPAEPGHTPPAAAATPPTEVHEDPTHAGSTPDADEGEHAVGGGDSNSVPAAATETPAHAATAAAAHHAAHPAPHGHEEKKGWSTGAKVGVGILGTLAVATAAAGTAAVYLGGKAIDAAGHFGGKVAEAGGTAMASAPEWMKTIGSGITYPFRKTYGFFKGLFGGGSSKTEAHTEPAHEEANAEAHPAADAHADEHKDEHAAAHHRKFRKAA